MGVGGSEGGVAGWGGVELRCWMLTGEWTVGEEKGKQGAGLGGSPCRRPVRGDGG